MTARRRGLGLGVTRRSGASSGGGGGGGGAPIALSDFQALFTGPGGAVNPTDWDDLSPDSFRASQDGAGSANLINLAHIKTKGAIDAHLGIMHFRAAVAGLAVNKTLVYSFNDGVTDILRVQFKYFGGLDFIASLIRADGSDSAFAFAYDSPWFKLSVATYVDGGYAELYQGDGLGAENTMLGFLTSIPGDLTDTHLHIIASGDASIGGINP